MSTEIQLDRTFSLADIPNRTPNKGTDGKHQFLPSECRDGGSMYLDCDTTPPIVSREAKHRRLSNVISQAKALLLDVNEGQIGIYSSAFGDGFKGYAIKYAGQAPFFEPAES